MRIVIDASVACKWFVPEDNAAQAQILLASQATFIAPDLIHYEVANLAWKKLLRGEVDATIARGMVADLPRFLAATFPPDRLKARAFALSVDLEHPAYDCFYAALAEQEAVPYVSADMEFIERLLAASWPGHVIALADVTPDLPIR